MLETMYVGDQIEMWANQVTNQVVCYLGPSFSLSES